MYADLYTKPRLRPLKILSGLALFVLVASGIFFFTQDSAPTRASRRTLIEHETVNVSPRQIGILWQTEEPDVGWILYGNSPSNLTQIALDERDTDGERGIHRYHYAVIRDVEPDTEYYYKIVSDNELISKEGEAFAVRTLPGNAPLANTSPIYGKVLQPNGQPARNTFALVMVDTAVPLLAQTGSTGEWLVPIQYMAQKESLQHVPITEETIITIQFFDEESRSLVRSTINRSRPLPQTITLGNNYSFVADSTVLSAQSTREEAPSEARQESVDVRFPRQNAVIPGTAPLIKGTGIPGKQVTISINSKPPISSVIAVDDEGVWTLPMRDTLDPGAYRLTVRTQDAQNNTLTITRDFTMIKSGERVLGETTATPAGTLTPTSSLSPTIIVTTSTPTPLPTSVVSAAPTVTPMVVTATPAPPVSGTNVLPYLTAGIGMFLLGVGVILLL